MPSIFDKLIPVVARYNEIENTMSQPEIAVDFEKVQVLAKERASLEDLVGIAHQHQSLAKEQQDLKSISDEGGDAELVLMAREELDSVNSRRL